MSIRKEAAGAGVAEHMVSRSSRSGEGRLLRGDPEKIVPGGRRLHLTGKEEGIVIASFF